MRISAPLLILKIAPRAFILSGALLLAACATLRRPAENPDSRPIAAQWTEAHQCCPDDPVVMRTYAYSFDDRDYEVIADLKAGFHLPARVFWKAPLTDECEPGGMFRTVGFATFQKDMPTLRYETWAQFLKRNRPIPAHRLSLWRGANGRLVTIVPPQPATPIKQFAYSAHGSFVGVNFRSRWIPREDSFTRAGFSADGWQALIFDGWGLYLCERRGGVWHEVAGSTVYID